MGEEKAEIQETTGEVQQTTIRRLMLVQLEIDYYFVLEYSYEKDMYKSKILKRDGSIYSEEKWEKRGDSLNEYGLNNGPMTMKDELSLMENVVWDRYRLIKECEKVIKKFCMRGGERTKFDETKDTEQPMPKPHTTTSTSPNTQKFNLSIAEIFRNYVGKESGLGIKAKNDGNYKVECPCCGLQAGREQGFILFSDGNRAFCHSSQKHFNILESYALLHGFIKCMDGRDKGEYKFVLEGDLFKQVLDHFRNNYGDETFAAVSDELGLRREIELPGNGVHDSRFASQIGEIVAPKLTMFYRPKFGVYEIEKVKMLKGDYEMAGLVEVSPTRFITLTENFVKPFEKKPIKGGEYININKSMNQTTAKIVLVSDNFSHKLHVLERMFQVPIPLIDIQDKLCMPKKGYDERFGTHLGYNTPEINMHMSLEDAKAILHEVYKEFCFKDEIDRSKAISALLTPFCKGLMGKFNVRTPVYCYIANRERSGKDYCAGVTGIVYEGHAIEDTPISDGEFHRTGKNDELQKTLISVARMGRRRYHSANNKGHLDSAAFEEITTNGTLSKRLLSKNEMLVVPNEIDFSLSGNLGITFTSDLENRSVFINLFLDIEDANERKFERPNLHGWVLENRSMVLSALYTLVRNWDEKGRPKGSVSFASFPKWAEVVGGIMDAAGYLNPAQREKEKMVSNPENAQIKLLFELCHAHKPNQYMEKKEIVQVIEKAREEELELYNEFDLSTRSDATKFWTMFNRYVGRIFSDIKLLNDDKNRASMGGIVSSKIRKYTFYKENLDKGIQEKTDKNNEVLQHLDKGIQEEQQKNQTKVDKVDKVYQKTNDFDNIDNNLYTFSMYTFPESEPLEPRIEKNFPENLNIKLPNEVPNVQSQERYTNSKTIKGIQEDEDNLHPNNIEEKTDEYNPYDLIFKQMFEMFYEYKPNEYITRDEFVDIITKFKERKEVIDIIINNPFIDSSRFNYDKSNHSECTRFWLMINRLTNKPQKLTNIMLTNDDVDKQKRGVDINSLRRKYMFYKESLDDNDKKDVKEQPTNAEVPNLNSNAEVPKSTPKIILTNPKAIALSKIGGHVHNPDTPKPKVGSDRQVQFWESNCWDTRNVKITGSVEEVYEFIKNNPGCSCDDLLDKFPIGGFKFLGILEYEGLVREEGDNLWIT